MASQSSETLVTEMKKLLTEKEDLDDAAEGESQKLNAELDGTNPLPPCDPITERIKKGFHRFKTCKFDKYPEYFAQLAEDQHPKFLVFACSDSRVSPSHVLDFQLGGAFMVRNIASLVPKFNQLRYSCVGATIEYAILTLEVKNILVIGHSCCGGIKRLMSLPDDGSTNNDFIDDWVKVGLPAKDKVKKEHGDLNLEEQTAICEREAVNLSLFNLLKYPYVQRAFAKGALALRGGHYDFVNGKFELWELKPEITPYIIIQ